MKSSAVQTCERAHEFHSDIKGVMPSYASTCEMGIGRDLDFLVAADQGNAASSSAGGGYSLDFAGVLDAADTALHQQIYEFFQGPTAQPEAFKHSSLPEEETFSIPTSYTGSASFSAAPSPFLSGMPGVSLYETNDVERRMFDELPGYFTEGTLVTDIDFGIARKPFQSVQSPMPAALSMQATSVTSDYLYNSGQLSDNGDRVLHAPHLGVHRDPYNQVECGGRSLAFRLPNTSSKRAGDEISPQSQPRRKTAKLEPRQRDSKSKRSTEQAEHIIRERQRRDDMTSKYLLLESLLPPGSKRDRSTIVDDSIEYVKNLHHRLTSLQEKRSQMKSTAAAASLKYNMPTGDTMKQNHSASDGLMTETALPDVPGPTTKVPSSNEAVSLQGVKEQEHLCKPEALLNTYVDMVKVHLDLPHQLVIEMTCRPHAHIQSQILRALERLGLDVPGWTITKLLHRMICVIVAKPRVVSHFSVTSDDVMTALKCALVPESI